MAQNLAPLIVALTGLASAVVSAVVALRQTPRREREPGAPLGDRVTAAVNG
jgi:hypothetical protein